VVPNSNALHGHWMVYNREATEDARRRVIEFLTGLTQ
jgi:hypothetical protein